MTTADATRTWTYDDLMKLPDDGKYYEIIDGELYEMPAPKAAHQLILAVLFELLLGEAKRLFGRVLPGPVGVFMPGADPVQPDLLFLTSEHLGLISERGIEGAPDLVIEILSPSNARHDRTRKRAIYEQGGVPEYWIVSPEAETIEVLVLEAGKYRPLVRAGYDERVTSAVLPELSFPASAAFATVPSQEATEP